MSDIAIKFENISKQYRLGLVGTGTISHDLNRWWHTVRGKEDPYLKIGEINDRSIKATSDYIWALKNIDFEVKQGDIVGIIGRNGAGKSTLLKLLSRVTAPTTGSIKAKGRIASLLEVGTGFHPELTGRENIYINGAILGMTKSEIKSKLDEIIDFAGVEKYIDTPTKRYSSGMTVRLGFAIAAHLDPEILVVDEVLAVGDAEFQRKAIGKMQDVSQTDGRTVLFVSHNMGSIKNLCTRGIILENGSVGYMGDVESTLEKYLIQNTDKNIEKIEFSSERKGTGAVKFADFWVENEHGTKIDTILTGEDVYFAFTLKIEEPTDGVDIGFSLHDPYGDAITNLYSSYQDTTFNFQETGYQTIRIKMNDFPIGINSVLVKGLIKTLKGDLIDWPSRQMGSFYVENGDFYKTGQIRADGYGAKILIKGQWEYVK